MSSLVQITPPAVDALSLVDVKTFIRIAYTLEDALLLRFIRAATTTLESRLNRCFITQTWEYGLGGRSAWDYDRYGTGDRYGYGYDWPDRVFLPRAPLQSVVSVTYRDENNVDHVLPPTEYVVDTSSVCGSILQVYGKSWPSIGYSQPDPVRIRFVAGYGDGPASIPQPIIIGLLGLVADYESHRNEESILPSWVDAMLANYKVMVPR